MNTTVLREGKKLRSAVAFSLGIGLVLGLLSGFASPVRAANIGLVGLYTGKAIFVVDGRGPKTFTTGQEVAQGMRLISVDGNSAIIAAHGRQEKYFIGEYVNAAHYAPRATTLAADERGHFVTTALINGGLVQGIIDTGATLIALPATDAQRLGIVYRNGTPMRVATANGTVTGYRVTLDSVKIGELELHRVDAVIQETGLPFALFGMSFLNRTDMRRNGAQMVLSKRF